MSRDNIGGAVLRGGPAVVVPDRRDARIPGLDAARGLAILGMLAAHTLPGDGDAFYDGRSSILFATLAGVSLGLMSGGDHPSPRAHASGSPRSRIRLSITIRALLLIALGLSLWLLGTNIAIILDSYGFLFLVCIPLLFTNRWVLAALALLCALVGPIVVGALSAATSATGPLPVAPDNPLAVPLSWLDAYYPAPVWLGYVLAGLAIARFGVTRPAVQRIMIVGGAAAAALGYGVSAAIGDPVRAHTDTTMEAISSGALAIAVIGVLVVGVGAITSRRGRMLVRPLRRGRSDAVDDLHGPGARHRPGLSDPSGAVRRRVRVDLVRLPGARLACLRDRVELSILAGAPGVALRAPHAAPPVADATQRAASGSAGSYSHSIVPGGFDVTSSTTRFTPGTSLVMRFEMRASTS